MVAGTRDERGIVYCSEPTSDDVQLRIRRYPPVKEDNVVSVILCHGVLANKHSLDFGEIDSKLWKSYSLAGFLHGHSAGDINFDIWVPELRGRRSLSGSVECECPSAPEGYDWCIDDYVEKDIPAIVETVQNNCLAPDRQIFWVGMSMGGMLGYAYGETEEGFQNLAGVVTIGSPVAFEYNTSLLIEIASRFFPRKMSVMINLKEVLERFDEIKEDFIKRGANLENIEYEDAEKYVEVGFDNYLSSKVISQFALFFRHKNFCSYPARPWAYDILGRIPLIGKWFAPPSYKERLHEFKTPLLAIAGGKDEEAPPKEVKYAVAHVGSEDIRYLEFPEYGHLDLHVGLEVKKDVYECIKDWLIEQAKKNFET